jgi:hypothetical protein
MENEALGEKLPVNATVVFETHPSPALDPVYFLDYSVAIGFLGL